jgi:hypothetical protein
MASSMTYNTDLVGDPRARLDVRLPPELRQSARRRPPRPRLSRRWKRRLRSRSTCWQRGHSLEPGDQVVVHPNNVALQHPPGHDGSCTIRISVCGDSNRTTAASQSCISRRPTCSCRRPLISPGRKRRRCRSSTAPPIGCSSRLTHVGQAADDVHANRHLGKGGRAPHGSQEGQGVDDP